MYNYLELLDMMDSIKVNNVFKSLKISQLILLLSFSLILWEKRSWQKESADFANCQRKATALSAPYWPGLWVLSGEATTNLPLKPAGKAKNEGDSGI